MSDTHPPPSAEEAIEILVAWLAEEQATGGSYGDRLKYERADLSVAQAVVRYWSSRGVKVGHNSYGVPLQDKHMAPFCDAAWELCRMGVLRPGERDCGPAAGVRGSQGAHLYSITGYGQRWLMAEERRSWIAPSRIMDLLHPLASRFGPAFLPRATEAEGCYRAGQYMAACAMAGAAVESILIEVAAAKAGDRDKVLGEYQARQGRKDILKRIGGNLRLDLRTTFETLSETVSYWRDGAAHGVETRLGEVQASHALNQLVRLAQLADGRWDELTER